MHAEHYGRFPFWDPQGVAEPYLHDLRVQASWGGFDPDRPVFSGLIWALKTAYGTAYDFKHISQELLDIDRAAKRARDAMKADPRLMPSLFDEATQPPAWVPPVPESRRYPEATLGRDGAACPPSRLKSGTWSGPQTWGPEMPTAPEPSSRPVDPALKTTPAPVARLKDVKTTSEPADTTPTPVAPSPSARPTVIAKPKGKLHGARLYRSIAPTWFALVGFSWVALIWGAMISMPVGIGIGIAGGMAFGVIIVPIFATIFGVIGMNAASSRDIKGLNFQPVAEDDPLMVAAKRYATILGIPTPALGTMDVDNAYAMGSSPASAVVAIGKPLRRSMTEQQVLAVLGHELGHVVSGDMKRMMLMRSFQNATVWYMFVQGAKQFMRWVISWAGELFILAFSRNREYWADAIGAELAGKEAMIGALRALSEAPPLTAIENSHARFMIRGRFSGLLNTHPSFEQRVEALENEVYLRRLPRG